MFTIKREEERISFFFSSDFQLVDTVISHCREFLQGRNVGNSYSLRLVLRELLLNAVEHGNNMDPDKQVICIIEHGEGGEFRVVVGDQGSGFDYTNLDAFPPVDPYQERKRGYFIIRSLARSIHFNAAGNEVTVELILPAETSYDLKRDDEWYVIIPSGNITRISLEKMRELLLKTLKDRKTGYRFDFRNVEEMDPAGLDVFSGFVKTLENQTSETGIEFINLSPEIYRVLTSANINTLYFPSYADSYSGNEP